MKRCKRCNKEYNPNTIGATNEYGPECAKLRDNQDFESLFDLMDDGKVEWFDPIVGNKTRINKELMGAIVRKEPQELKRFLGVGNEREQSIALLRYTLEIFRNPDSDDIPAKLKDVLTNLINNQLKEEYKALMIRTLLGEMWRWLSTARSHSEFYDPNGLWSRICYRTKDEWIEISKRKDMMEALGQNNKEMFNLFIDKLKRGDF